MAWPKGQKRPDAFQKKEPVEKQVIYPDLPVNERLSDVVKRLKNVLQSYRCDIKTEIVEVGNVTTEATVTIRFLIR